MNAELLEQKAILEQIKSILLEKLAEAKARVDSCAEDCVSNDRSIKEFNRRYGGDV